MGFFDSIQRGLEKTRSSFNEQVNFLLNRGPDLDDEFWENLEEVLILSDIGAIVAGEIIDDLRYRATAEYMKNAYEVLDEMDKCLADKVAKCDQDPFLQDKACILFVGINGTGKTTTVGKLANRYSKEGRKVLLGSADTFRAAAIEQLDIWAKRAGVEIVSKERGSDPASVCFETLERAETLGSDLVLIDTAGRLHTSDDLMRELTKVVNVVKKRSKINVYTILVIDATTGQNGLLQAEQFNNSLSLNGLIVTKLDGTAKGGIAVNISNKLNLPIFKIGVGEGIDDLQDFDALQFAKALIGTFDDRYSN